MYLRNLIMTRSRTHGQTPILLLVEPRATSTPEEAPRRAGVAMPVVRDVAPGGVGPPALFVLVELRCHLAHAGQQPLFGLLIGKAVQTPDDHGGRADHALGHPALLVLVEPRRELVGEAELAVLVVGRERFGHRRMV